MHLYIYGEALRRLVMRVF